MPARPHLPPNRRRHFAPGCVPAARLTRLSTPRRFSQRHEGGAELSFRQSLASGARLRLNCRNKAHKRGVAAVSKNSCSLRFRQAGTIFFVFLFFFFPKGSICSRCPLSHYSSPSLSFSHSPKRPWQLCISRGGIRCENRRQGSNNFWPSGCRQMCHHGAAGGGSAASDASTRKSLSWQMFHGCANFET